jgi:HSP20 family molecular chaperone IbpA
MGAQENYMSDLQYYWKSFPLSQVQSAPFRQSILDHHEQLVNKFFDEFWGNRKNFIHSNTSYPKMDIYEDDVYFCINCSVPGVEEEDLDLETVAETRLFTIKGKSCLVRPNKHFDHLKELKLSAFTRTIQLPDYIVLDPEIVHLRNGILYLAFKKIVPKEEKQEETVKKITIKKS